MNSLHGASKRWQEHLEHILPQASLGQASNFGVVKVEQMQCLEASNRSVQGSVLTFGDSDWASDFDMQCERDSIMDPWKTRLVTPSLQRARTCQSSISGVVKLR